MIAGYKCPRSVVYVPALPLSRYTLTPPDPEKWRRHAAGIEPRLPGLAALAERAARAAGL